MTNTAIIGIGQTSVSEKWDTSLRHLAWYAVEAALDDAGVGQIDALFVGNLLAGALSNQRHLATLVADFSGLRGVEAVLVEAGEASGGAAMRQAILAVASGQIETALVLGVEKSSDTTGSAFTAAEATVLDADYEQVHGMTLEAAAALLMRRYMHEYGVEVSDFANFSVNAHANGSKNSLAMYRNKLRADKFTAAPVLADPVTLFDAAPGGDGAAAVIITRSDRAAELSPHPVQIAGSAMATDALSLHDRPDMLWLEAAARSARRAMQAADVTHDEIDLFELHDAFTVLAALSLEATGFAPQGQGVRLARDGQIMPGGRIPISTFGGLKARGNPYGATGVYQIVEVVRQLRGQAGPNQIPGARIGLAQNLGSLGATAVTHVLRV